MSDNITKEYILLKEQFRNLLKDDMIDLTTVNPQELTIKEKVITNGDIYKKLIVTENNWVLDKSIKVSFFKKNYDKFKFYGRDMELLFTKCKRAHSSRIFSDASAIKKTLTMSDLNIALKTFILNK